MRIFKAVSGPMLGCLASWLMGCASPGVPRPPSLRLPERATHVQAERVGGEVRLTWTTPADTTDGDAIRGGTLAVICRRAGTGVCIPVGRQGGSAGPAQAVDALPGTLRVGADSLLEYRVELRNDRGRSAGVSEPAFAPGGRAPETPAELSAQARREGVLLTWQPETGGAAGAFVELHRTVAEVAPAPVKVVKRSPAKVAMGAPKAKDGPLLLVAEGSAEAGGMVDRSARTGETYIYTAERVRKVLVAGHAMELRSAAAAPVTITYRSTFAPVPPTGLASIPGGGFGAATSIDLSWEPNEEIDLAGYIVYRAVDGGAFARLTEKAIAGAAYRDLQVSRGHAYAYRVTAVDAEGNESGKSAAVKEVLR